MTDERERPMTDRHTLEDVQRAATAVVEANPDTLNPMQNQVCTYFGPDGTTCLGGAVLLELGVPLPEVNTSVKSSAGMSARFEPDALDLLQYIQTAADRGFTLTASREIVDAGDVRMPWREAYDFALHLFETEQR